MIRCAVLTYHSQNVRGHGTDDNDHVALQQDLQALHDAGRRIAPLSSVVDWLDGRVDGALIDGAVGLSFDDGCDFDVLDLDFPGVGPQRSFLGILQDFVGRHGPSAQPGLHATSFVIASPEARRVIDAKSLFGKRWMSDDWWKEASATGLMAIGSHGWDHYHPDLLPGAGYESRDAVADTLEACERQLVDAANFIHERAGDWPDLFAHPFGESSAYMRGDYLPNHRSRHRCRAAFGTEAGDITADSHRWNLPRYVCGRDWRNPDELLQLIKEQ